MEESLVKRILGALEKAFEKFGVDYYMVGAFARDLWFKKGTARPARATKDIDLAVLIKDEAQFDNIKRFLQEHKGFSVSKNEGFKVIAPDGTDVDLIPFGEIESGKGMVALKAKDRLKVDGFQAVHEIAVEEVENEEGVFRVASLAGIVILKLISWNDRPDKRGHDIKDISQIIEQFFYINDERIWKEHSDLFEGELGIELVGARVLGRDMGRILARDEALSERIHRLIDSSAPKEDGEPILEEMSRFRDKSIEESRRLLKEIVVGIREGKAAP